MEEGKRAAVIFRFCLEVAFVHGNAVEDHNAWCCTACSDHTARRLRYVGIVKTTYVVVDVNGVDCVEVGVEVGVGSCQCFYAYACATILTWSCFALAWGLSYGALGLL